MRETIIESAKECSNERTKIEKNGNNGSYYEVTMLGAVTHRVSVPGNLVLHWASKKPVSDTQEDWPS